MNLGGNTNFPMDEILPRKSRLSNRFDFLTTEIDRTQNAKVRDGWRRRVAENATRHAMQQFRSGMSLGCHPEISLSMKLLHVLKMKTCLGHIAFFLDVKLNV